MILLVDVGNTNIVIGVCKDNEYIAGWRISTDSKKTSDEYGIQMIQLFHQSDLNPKEVKGIIISSVVPNIMHSLENMVKKSFNINPIIVGPGVKTGINIKYDNPKEVGADRIVNAVAAHEIYRRDVIIIDFGTATTYCAVTEDGNYLGGCICQTIYCYLAACQNFRLCRFGCFSAGRTFGGSDRNRCRSIFLHFTA